jgi:hypothetical protein
MVTLLGAATLMLSQCTMVGDNVTGLDLMKGNATNCVKQCNDLYKMLYDQEQKRYDTEKSNCLALPQPQKDQCVAAADAQHQANMAQLGEDKINCQNNCHSQGTGSGG